MTNFWHPFADMSAILSKGAMTLVRGEGAHVWDDRDRRYLDGTAALWYCNVGWGRREIADAAAAQMVALPSYSTFGDLTNFPVEALADRISAVAPVGGSKIFFTSGGSDSIDTAAKMVRRYWRLKGDPRRTILIRREKAYHGMHTGGTSLAGIPANASGHGSLIEGVLEVPWDEAGTLRAAIEHAGHENVAGFFCEPVIGAGGVFPPPEGYLREVRDVCRDTGVLFVADEVITGFGRCGDWFASSRFALEPDIITCAKGITSGYLPMGAVIASPWVTEPFWTREAGMWRHGYTYSGHATAAAAALANIEIMEREDLCGRALELEVSLRDALGPLAAYDVVHEVRAGVGVLAAVQLRADARQEEPGLPARLSAACRDAGVLVRPLVGGAVAVSPPLVIDAEGLKELAEGFRAGLDACA